MYEYCKDWREVLQWQAGKAAPAGARGIEIAEEAYHLNAEVFRADRRATNGRGSSLRSEL